MEYVIGSLVTILAIYLIRRHFLSIPEKQYKISRIVYRQSHIFDLIKLSIPFISGFEKQAIPTQTTKHNDSRYIPVVFTKDKAYWIKENAFYEADIVDGIIDDSSKKIVDTMSMDNVQLEKMIAIVDALTARGKDDRSNPRNEDF